MLDIERRFREEFELEPAQILTDLSDEAGDFDTFNRRAALEEIEELTGKIGGLGGVNIGAVAQFEAVKERLDFLTEQKNDLEGAKAELDAIIAEIDATMREQFMRTFSALVREFEATFTSVFGGGRTHLTLTDPENLLETGIDLRVQMPGKAAQDISLLSGGERALTALSFLMAILRVRPAPFVILDEVDAPLDQSNVGRFTDLLRQFTDQTQFIVITHNNGTMQAADVLYGVTQQEPGISTLTSVRLADETEMESNRRVAVV
jgi:chromosome segregation protein